MIVAPSAITMLSVCDGTTPPTHEAALPHNPPTAVDVTVPGLRTVKDAGVQVDE